MKKKKISIIAIIAVTLLFVPIPLRLKDGGSTEYKALLYSVTKIHKLNDQSSTGYEDGWKIKILGIQVYNETDILINFEKDNNYELVIDTNGCFNCYIEVYEFNDGTKVYNSCPKITYKNNNVELSLSEALDQKLITLSDLETEDFLIIKPDEETCTSCCE